MSGENYPLVVGSKTDNSFYTGKEASTGEPGTSGKSRYILHGLTIISVLIATGCTIYGSIHTKSAFIALPLIVVLIWLFIHFLLVLFTRKAQDDFQAPAWFIFVSSGHIVIQSLIVIILTL